MIPTKSDLIYFLVLCNIFGNIASNFCAMRFMANFNFLARKEFVLEPLQMVDKDREEGVVKLFVMPS